MKYKWIIKEANNFTNEFLEASYNSQIIAQLLLNKGIDTTEKAIEFLNPSKYIESLPEEIPDLLKAKDRILKAIKENEKITIFGDYDVDGVTSTSCLLVTLKEFTENVDYYIPSRLTEGYGLNEDAVRTIAKKNKAKLLITCDCGITNHKEIELANSLGVDVIVTDHHSLPEILPKAHAVLNPKLLPEDHKLHFLPGVGVAYKLAEAILQSSKEKTSDLKPELLLDLVTLGMIADLAPLTKENRYLVQIGLEKLANTQRIGLKELFRVCGLNSHINAEHVGFGIAPRINAVGRLTDANLAVKLFTTENEIEALHLACELDIQNKERQLICEQTLNEAIEMIDLQKLDHPKCIVLAKESWHHGVIGIVASRLVEKYHKPVILIAIDKKENIARGSGRSIYSFDLFESVSQCTEYLEKFGGHKAACGLSIKPENIDKFISLFSSYASEILNDTDIEPVLGIDMELPLSSVNLDLIEKINKLSPFGFGNKMPVFSSGLAEVANIRTIGKNNQHLKLFLKDIKSQRFFEALIWNHDLKNTLRPGDKIKTAFTPKLNEFNGETLIQLEIKDFEVEVKSEKIEVKQENSFSQATAIFDFRNNTDECIKLTSGKNDVVFFAERNQKDFFPLRTFSRKNISGNNTLVILEPPPDEDVFFELVKSSGALNIYLAYKNNSGKSESGFSLHVIKKLAGMLRYVENNKEGKISKTELECALGLNRTALIFALEVLIKTGFLTCNQSLNDLNIKISNPTRQISPDLIEYTLFHSELKKINEFSEWLESSSVQEITKLFIKKGFVCKEEILVS